ncbi:MAG TPA: glycosyltransferase family 2 protein [Bacteroidota bacterium]|nr:glycosyltransferase family 2 protein [Bacteroidota bacterium]
MVLSIIIVNYNSKPVLRRCLHSILECQLPFPYEVFIIDNASDESISDLKDEFQAFVFVFNPANIGFAGACNAGILQSSGTYVLLLNPDTVLNPGSLPPMIEYLEEHRDVAVSGCKIFDSLGGIEHSTHSFPTLTKEFFHANEFLKSLVRYDSVVGGLLRRFIPAKSLNSYSDHSSIMEVDHVTGACMMVRRAAIDRVGLLDEAFFLYNEEVEWSYRMKCAGYKTVFLPGSSIIHHFGYSTKQRVQKQTANRLLVERYRGMFYFFQKHYGFAKLMLLRLIVIQGFTLRLFLAYIKRISHSGLSPFLVQEIQCLRSIIELAFANNFDWRKER